MEIKTTLSCPKCKSTSIKKNGIKSYGKQNYKCKDCSRQFIGDHNLTYKGCHSDISKQIKMMLVRGDGIRDIAILLCISINKVLSVLVNSSYKIVPKHKHYNTLEIDELWTYVGKKKNKKWLLYIYSRETGEIICYVFGGRDLWTARKLKKKLLELDISYNTIYSDNWDSFLIAFGGCRHNVGKQNTFGIEGNNCRLRCRIRRVFRRTCCFSKKMLNHIKAFEIVFFHINFGYV